VVLDGDRRKVGTGTQDLHAQRSLQISRRDSEPEMDLRSALSVIRIQVDECW
jgi:hypothetical protein